MASPPHPALADGAVRHVGDPVAFIVAETPQAARDAAELISVDYAMQPAVIDVATATGPGAPLVWPDVANNVVFDWEIGDKAKTDALFATAAHVTRLTVVNNRVIVASMEARASIADFDAASGRWTLYCQHAGRLADQDPDRSGLQHRAGEFPRHHARCRRRLRHEGVPLRRARADLLCGAQTGAAGEVGIGSRRGVPVRHAWPRQRHARRACDRRGRQVPGAAHAQLRQHGRLSLDVRAVYPDAGRRRRAGRRLRLPGRSTPTYSACSPTRCRWMPIAAPVVPRATTCWSAWSMPPRASLASTASELRRRNMVPSSAMPHATPVGKTLRHRRLRHGAGCGAERDGLRRLRRTARGVRAAWQASRHRPRLLSRGHHGRSDRAGGNPLRRRWLCRRVCRHAIDRPGSRDRPISSSCRSGSASTARRSASARATRTPFRPAAAPVARAASIPKARRSC